MKRYVRDETRFPLGINLYDRNDDRNDPDSVGVVMTKLDELTDDELMLEAATRLKKQTETLQRIAKILEYVPGINDERDSVPILLAIKAEMEKLNA
jgi:Ca2+-dependent lipid-binding protein